MLLSRPLQVVTPSVDGDVLAVLARAEAGFTPPEVQSLIGLHSVAGVRNALRRLASQGIVHSERVGRAYTYRLNRAHVSAPYIVGLAEAGHEVFDRMRQTIALWQTPCEYAAVFGSAATGRMTAESDIDVFVVRPNSVDGDAEQGWRDQLDEFVRACNLWTGNDTQILEMSVAEVGRGAGTERVLEDIASEGIPLAGPATYLTQRLVAGGKDVDGG